VKTPLPLRRTVIRLASGRCEYCGLSQIGQEAQFHVDHIYPLADGGATTLENLALACVSRSLRKGARSKAPDPQTGKPAPLFHPRNQRWSDHFQWKGCRIGGRTPTGRATVDALKMNRLLAQGIRSEELLRGRHPPPN
jgi:5-methylcytosine-specific restriction endonuclease McrA